MARELFGTDGVRGKAGVYPLDQAGATQIGKAIGAYFAQAGETITIGCDPRESSPELVQNVLAGLTAQGVHSINVGVLPTPGLAYLTKQLGAAAGIMITASHNPYSDNGIKIFSSEGGKLPDSAEITLNERINSEIPDRGTGQVTDSPSAVAAYEDFLVSTVDGTSFEGLQLAIDSANGATSGLAARVFEKLGAKVMPLFDKPDGRNINVACGATDTAALQATVMNQQLSAGIALDGDGDRVMLVDEQGRQMNGDYLLYLLAITGGQAAVVATIMSNMGLENALATHGIALHRVAVGDRYVLEGLAQNNLTLGGEQSGHIIQTQYAPTGDGLLAALQSLKQVKLSGKSLAQWYDELVLLPQALVNLPLTDKTLLNRPDIVSFMASKAAELGTSGRVNIRPSGTEPKLRVMVEAPDAPTVAQQIAEQLAALLAQPANAESAS